MNAWAPPRGGGLILKAAARPRGGGLMLKAWAPPRGGGGLMVNAWLQPLSSFVSPSVEIRSYDLATSDSQTVQNKKCVAIGIQLLDRYQILHLCCCAHDYYASELLNSNTVRV